ncbi:sugar transferase [Lacrimispora sp.]|jgi:exopolysaccharide biosynthesis polyprenyl glycosylphosphotransferase|uniref:sugar transferase n=1 Tax=Lacrimispora sp. TaxID=2719234 RepID=UPI0028A59292|nr:sugar transferase [Lacrimispora sp.]
MSDYEQYKRLVRFAAGMVLIVIEMLLFAYVWVKFYNPKMEWPYVRLGHYFIATVYAFALFVFSNMYGALKLGYMRIYEAIYAQTLASICTNALMYIPIVLLTKHFQSIIPLFWMTIADFNVIFVWSIIAIKIYRALYPPRRVLLVYGERPISVFLDKINDRTDRFVIGEALHISEGEEAIQKRIKEYEGVVICDIPSHIRNSILKYCYGKSIRVYATPKISDIIIRSAENLHFFDTPLILARNNGLTFEQLFIKRIVDLIVSFTALIILSPIMLISALAIKLYDKGPIFFFQDRCTKDGKVFSICKFRSMIVDAEKEGESIPATEKDPRITPIGAVIRKYRIDELPQIFNIIKGDMSLVGPRPERIEHVRLYSEEIPEFEYRMKVKGGLTGFAQVYGKYNTSAYDKLKLDLMYIQNYSFLLDIEIIFKTVKILFMKESTEGFSQEAATKIHGYKRK